MMSLSFVSEVVVQRVHNFVLVIYCIEGKGGLCVRGGRERRIKIGYCFFYLACAYIM